MEVTLRRGRGPLLLVQQGRRAAFSELCVLRTDRGVQVGAEGVCVDLVEHLLAALSALRVRVGLEIHVEGPELPLLDGGAQRWTQALEALGPWSPAPRLSVTRSAEFEVGQSRYQFEPSAAVEFSVNVDFGPHWDTDATFAGTLGEWRHIASARTFGYAHEAESLRSVGRARHIDPETVLILDEGGRALGTPQGRDELVRHKLLDLIGDAFLYGGVPAGRLTAVRPGHTSNHRAFAWAREHGVLAPLVTSNPGY